MSPDTLHDVRRLLAVRMDNIGDVVMLGPALRALKRALPDAEITLLATRAGASVAPLVPNIDRVIEFRPLWQDISGTMSIDLAPERWLAEDLASRRFDAALIFTSFAQSPYPPARVCTEAGIPIRVGQSKEFGGGLLTTWVRPFGDEAHQVDRNLHLLRAVGVDDVGTELEMVVPEPVRLSTRRLLADAGVSLAAPFVVLAPGASCDARSYGAERFAAAAREIARRADAQVLLVGSPREVGLCETVRSLAADPRVVSIAEATDVPTLAAVVERAALVVCNDSAPMHVADALGTPVLVTFSGTDLESQWAPRHAPAELLRKPTPCSPCYGFTCDLGKACLAISPHEVARRALELMRTEQARPRATAVG